MLIMTNFFLGGLVVGLYALSLIATLDNEL